jgi:NAD(P)-dependent dehydrogenase (short-subunit alcohol dehydrogenase family)
MLKLDKKVAVVTGGNSGIGLAAAKELKANGAHIAISGRNKQTLAEAAEQLGSDTLAMAVDVAQPSELERFFAQVKDRFGKVEILFVNAGVAESSSMADASEEHFDRIFNTNVRGAFFTVQKAVPLLSDGASVIFNSSVTAHTANPTSSVYSASKAALLSFVRTFAAELIGRGIRVNALSPGAITTPIWAPQTVPKDKAAERVATITERIPLKRFGSPDEIAKAVLFLASSDSSYVIGTELLVDGGLVGLR